MRAVRASGRQPSIENAEVARSCEGQPCGLRCGRKGRQATAARIEGAKAPGFRLTAKIVELEGIEPSSAEGLQPAIRPFPCSRLYSCLIAGSNRTGKPALTAGSFSDVSGLSRRQWSFPTVLHCFCCRAAVDWPRVTFLLAMTLCYLTKS